MSKYAIQVEGLGKEYIIGGAEQRHDSFREMLTGALTSPLRKLHKLGGAACEEERFWALKDISFNVEPGEVLGIIGRNGAGKSTLLKVLCRITSPTLGRVITRGRMASLLEVGTGFHPELTGRENIYLNGAILGMSRQEIQGKFDEIVDFAEVDKFLDTPVKRYSSGMYIRLAFSVAAHLEPEILVVDEVLAVGDFSFQEKCLGKMRNVAREGRTVLFVSHNLGAIDKLCSRCLLLNDGRVVLSGYPDKVIQDYTNKAMNTGGIEKEFSGPLAPSLSVLQILVNSDKPLNATVIRPSQKIEIRATVKVKSAVGAAKATLSILRDGTKVLSMFDIEEPADLKPGNYVLEFEIPAFLLSPGTYVIDLGIHSEVTREWIWGKNLASIGIQNEWHQNYDTTADMGLINIVRKGQRKRVS